MNTQTIKGTVKNIKRLNNSYNGNPNYKLDIETDNGVLIPVSTLNDYMVNYVLDGSLEDQLVTLSVKVNRKSNKLLDIKKGV